MNFSIKLVCLSLQLEQPWPLTNPVGEAIHSFPHILHLVNTFFVEPLYSPIISTFEFLLIISFINSSCVFRILFAHFGHPWFLNMVDGRASHLYSHFLHSTSTFVLAFTYLPIILILLLFAFISFSNFSCVFVLFNAAIFLPQIGQPWLFFKPFGFIFHVWLQTLHFANIFILSPLYSSNISTLGIIIAISFLNSSVVFFMLPAHLGHPLPLKRELGITFHS